MGGRFGLQTLASAVVPPPLWFHGPPGNAHALLHGLTTQPAGPGSRSSRPWLASRWWPGSLGGRTVGARRRDVLGGRLERVREIALQPTNTAMALLYVETVLWPVGMLVWGVAAVGGGRACREMGGLASSAELLRASQRAQRGQNTLAGGSRAAPGVALLLSATAAVFVGGTVNAAILTGGAMNQAAREDGGLACFTGFRPQLRQHSASSLVDRSASPSSDTMPTLHWICSTALCGC